jgi:tryptophan synthase alpha chain
MNRINKLFQEKKNNILSVYFTAGHPSLNAAPVIINALEKAGADMIEIGMPFSDPMADGPVIQNSSSKALKNGMTLKILFQQLKDIRKEVDIPLLLMGYLNPVLQYGMEKFCNDCVVAGIDGVILPDLPLQVYQEEYQQLFETKGIHKVFLVSPQTTSERIRQIDTVSHGFLYFVSSSSTTGIKEGFTADQDAYFERIRDMKLKNPSLIGFGISNHESFSRICQYANGAIIGSAFVKALEINGSSEKAISEFIGLIRGIIK